MARPTRVVTQCSKKSAAAAAPAAAGPQVTQCTQLQGVRFFTSHFQMAPPSEFSDELALSCKALSFFYFYLFIVPLKVEHATCLRDS